MATVIVTLVEGEILDGNGELGVGRVRRDEWSMDLRHKTAAKGVRACGRHDG